MSDTSELPALLLATASNLTSKSFEKLLKDQFKVIHAESPEQSWEILQQDDLICVLVCELTLAIDEWGLLERIRQVENKALASLPVLLLVAENDDEESQDRAFSVGATDFINMPFSGIELKARVRLHSKLYGLHHRSSTFELSSQNSSVDILSTLMQEKYFLNRLEQEISFSTRHKSFVSVCLVKIDNVASIEQRYGKEVLKPVLGAVAKIIEKLMRREDIYAYFGDETFALLYPVTNGLGANIAIKRLMEKVQDTQIKHNGDKISLSLSAGIFSMLPTENLSSDRVMEVVGQRLAKAEKQGDTKIVSSKEESEDNRVSIEQALNMISFKRAQPLVHQIPGLVDNLLPLLEFIQENNKIEFNRILDIIEDDAE